MPLRTLRSRERSPCLKFTTIDLGARTCPITSTAPEYTYKAELAMLHGTMPWPLLGVSTPEQSDITNLALPPVGHLVALLQLLVAHLDEVFLAIICAQHHLRRRAAAYEGTPRCRRRIPPCGRGLPVVRRKPSASGADVGSRARRYNRATIVRWG